MNFLPPSVGLDSPDLAPKKQPSPTARQIRARLVAACARAYRDAHREIAKLIRECDVECDAEGVDSDELDSLADVGRSILNDAETHLVAAILAGHPLLPIRVEARDIPKHFLTARGVAVEGTLYIASPTDDRDEMELGDATKNLHVMRLATLEMADVVDGFMEGIEDD